MMRLGKRQFACRMYESKELCINELLLFNINSIKHLCRQLNSQQTIRRSASDNLEYLLPYLRTHYGFPTQLAIVHCLGRDECA